jgi:uncharacterized membrane protein
MNGAFWSRERIALTACAGVSGLALLYVGLFQIDKLGRLACPFFGSGCESVALADFSWPLGMADGLLAAAYAGAMCALAQLRGKEWAAGLVGAAFVWVLLNFIGVAEMQKFGAWCSWCLLPALLSLPIVYCSVKCARQLQQTAGAGAGAPPPAAPGDQSA